MAKTFVHMLTIASLFLLLGGRTYGQRYVTTRNFGEQSEEYQIADAILQKLVRSNKLPTFQWSIAEKKQDIEGLGRPVWLLAPMIRALRNDPGKLAFVFAQGIAHFQTPIALDGKPLICSDKREEAMATMGDPLKYVIKTLSECEAMADPIAIRYMAAAGYSPFDASALLGNVFLSAGHIKNEPQWIQDYDALHPSDRKRFDDLRSLVISFCRENSAGCHADAGVDAVAGGGVQILRQNGEDFTERYPWYTEAVKQAILKNWRQNTIDPSVRAADSTKTTAKFIINRDGSVKDIRISQPSGNRSMDESVQRALFSIAHLATLPANYDGSYVSVIFEFRTGESVAR